MTEEQADIIREAAAYRWVRCGIGPVKGEWVLDIRATRSRDGGPTIWGPRILGAGNTYNETNKLRDRAMAAYRKLTTEKQ